jgi:hypothetical protein
LRGWSHAHAPSRHLSDFGGWRFALKEALHEVGTVTAVDPTQAVDFASDEVADESDADVV